MSINEKTKYKISNKYDSTTNKFIQNEYDFEDKGNYATGKINWSTQKKNKQGEVSFVNSSLKFICFGETKELIANNLGAKFNIEASLCNESFTGKDGKKVSFWQLTVFKADIAEEAKEKPKSMDKIADSYFPEDDFDDELPSF